MDETGIIGAIDIGTSEIRVGIARPKGKHPEVLGYASIPSKGVRKGELVHFREASELIHEAIGEAEKAAGVQLESIFLGQTGGHVQGFLNTASVNIPAANNQVTQQDFDKAIREAKAKSLPEDRVYIHFIQNGIRLDHTTVDDPVGMYGTKLEVDYWCVHGDTQRVRHPIHAINAFGLKVEDVILNSLGSAQASLHALEKESGTLLIDMGAGTTDFAVYQNGTVQLTGILPVGGDHITNDLAAGLRISREQAQAVQQNPSPALSMSEAQGAILEVDGRAIPMDSVQAIIDARVKESFELIRKILEQRMGKSELSSGVVLSGGLSLMGSLENTAEQAFDSMVRRSVAPDWVPTEMQSPRLSTLCGLLCFGVEHMDGIKPRGPKIFRKFRQLFKS